MDISWTLIFLIAFATTTSKKKEKKGKKSLIDVKEIYKDS